MSKQSNRFEYNSGFDVDVTEQQKDARRASLESVFSGDFKPVPLDEAIERGKIEDGDEIARLCKQHSRGLYPDDTTKGDKMAFIFLFNPR